MDKRSGLLIAAGCVVALILVTFLLIRKDYQNDPSFHAVRWHVSGIVVDSHSNAVSAATVTISGSGQPGIFDHVREKSSAQPVILRQDTDAKGAFNFSFESMSFALIVEKDGFQEEFRKFSTRKDSPEQSVVLVLREAR